jgi:hypothetical protein
MVLLPRRGHNKESFVADASATKERLSSLPTLTKAALHELWREVFQTADPPPLRRDLMVSCLAYRIQEQAFGSLRYDVRNRLRQLARVVNDDSKAGTPALPHIKAGTRLIREWRDQVHVVTVADEGYEYQGARYGSLSEIARLITGTRRSGPLFFGLNLKRRSSSVEAQ